MKYNQIVERNDWHQHIREIDNIITALYDAPNVDHQLIDKLKTKFNWLLKNSNNENLETLEITANHIKWYDDYPWTMLLDRHYQVRHSVLRELEAMSIVTISQIKRILPITKDSGDWKINNQKIKLLNDYILNKLSLLDQIESFSEIDQVVDGLTWENFYSLIDLNMLFHSLPEYILSEKILEVFKLMHINVDSKRIINRLDGIIFKDFIKEKTLQELESVNKDKLNTVYTQLFEILRKEFLIDSGHTHQIIFEISPLFKYLSLTTILLLLPLKDRDAICPLLKKYNIHHLVDLRDIVINTGEYIILKPLLDLVSFDYLGTFSDIIAQLPQNKKQVLEGRVSGHTLQYISDQLNITRERSRQIEKSVLISLMTIVDKIADILIASKGFFTGNDVARIFDDEFEILTFIRVLDRMSDKYSFIYYVDLFIDNIPYEDIFKDIINHYCDEIGSIQELFEKIQLHLKQHHLHFINASNLSEFLSELMEFRVMNDMYIKKDVLDSDFIAYIISEEFPEGIKLDHKEDNPDMLTLKQYMRRHYPKIYLSSNNRSLTSRITSSQYLILRDRGKYISISNMYISDKLLKDIYDWIKQKNMTLTYKEVFQVFKSRLLSESNIDNFNFLHGVLKYYFSDSFHFGRDTFYNIHSEKMSTDQRVVQFVREHKIVSENAIMNEIPGIKDYQISNIIDRNKELLKLEDNRVSVVEAIDISPQELAHYQETIDKLLLENKGYISSKYLYPILLDTHDNIEILKDMGEKGFYNYLSRTLFEDYHFRYPHIVRSNGIFTRRDLRPASIIKKLFIEENGMLSKRHLESFRKKFHWAELTMYIFLREGRQNLIRISEDKYVTLEQSGVTDDMVAKVDEVLDHLVTDYYPTKDFVDFEKLPHSKFEWNNFFLEDIIRKFSTKYKTIDREKSGMHFISSVIVSQHSKFDTYQDIVVYELRKTGKIQFSEKELAAILEARGLIIHVIPLELRTGAHIAFDTDLGMFVLK